MKIEVRYTYKKSEGGEGKVFYNEFYTKEDFLYRYAKEGENANFEDFTKKEIDFSKFENDYYDRFDVRVLEDFEVPENKFFENGEDLVLEETWGLCSDAGSIMIENSKEKISFSNGMGGDCFFDFNFVDEMKYKNFFLIASSVPVSRISNFDCKERWIIEENDKNPKELAQEDTLFDFWAREKYKVKDALHPAFVNRFGEMVVAVKSKGKK